LVRAAHLTGNHVLFEGALVSSSYGIQIGKASEEFGDDVVFAFLDAPLATCLERIKQRRAAKGNFQPLNPDNTAKKFDSVAKSVAKIRDVHQRRVVMIDHTKPVQAVMKLFGVMLRKEPDRWVP
jgi:thymidylate kinase